MSAPWRLPDGWEMVVGVEVHLQLKTRTKAFCGCAVDFGGVPNSRVCPVCLGLPGALPVLNEEALRSALRVVAALNCEIHAHSKFDRKNYFYPDLPKGYQISQFDLPFGEHGWLELPPTSEFAGRRVGIRRIHLEEDTGKLVHDDSPTESTLDLNRAGTPLVEIVTEPDLHHPDEVYDYVRELHLTLSYLGVSDCDMEKGSMRCEPNVSVRRVGDTELGTKTEVKNLNSFRHARDAMRYEVLRQIELIESGGAVRQETRLWDPDRGRTAAMRAKEEAHDYRYFPEPDIPPIVLDQSFLDEIRAQLPESLANRRSRYVDTLDLPEKEAGVLLQSPETAAFFDAALEHFSDARTLTNWIVGDVQRELNERGATLGTLGLSPAALARLLDAVASGGITTKIGREVLTTMIETGDEAAEIIAEQNLGQISSTDDLGPVVDRAIAANERAVDDIKAGNQKAIGALVGFVMKETRGKANPALVHELISERLG